MKALGYLRPAIDIQVFFRFCQDRGYDPVATFVNLELPFRGAEYQRLLAYLQQHGPGFAVVVEGIEQLSSSSKEIVRSILELEELGAGVVCIKEEVSEPLAIAVEVWSRQHERLGGKVKVAMEERALKAEGLGKPAFGYTIGAGRRLEIVPEEAATVQLIYRLYLEENLGLRLIARYLNGQGITTRKGGRWSIVGIRDILRNRIYLGTYSRFGVRVPGSHAPIISLGIFERVQERLRARRRPGEYPRALPFLLSSLAYCGYCGNRMIGISRHRSWIRQRRNEQVGAEYKYYQCESRTSQSVCQYNTRRAEELESLVISELSQYTSREHLAQHKPIAPDVRALWRSQLEARQGAAERRLHRLLARVSGGDMTLQQLREVAGEVVQEQRDLERRLAELDALKEDAVAVGQGGHPIEVLQKIREGWEGFDFAQKKALLREVVDRVIVYDRRVETVLRL